MGATLDEVFKNIGAMIDYQNKKIDGIFPAAEYYKGATENLVAYLEVSGFHVKDLEYSDGYFIFGKGTNSTVSFHIAETPDWLYGIWWEVNGIDYKHPRKSKKELLEKLEQKRNLFIHGEFFCQYEPEIDKFKPSRSPFCTTIDIDVFVTPDEWSYMDSKEIIEFIYKEPYLAWMHDYQGVDFNREYHSREEAKEKFDKYFAKKNKDIIIKTKLQLEWLEFIKKIFSNQLDRVHILDRGSAWSPRFELFFVWDDFSDEIFDDEERDKGRASCRLEDFPFESFELNSSQEEFEKKKQEMDVFEIDGEQYYYWEYNSVGNWLEIVSSEQYASWEKDGLSMPTLTEFLETIYPNLDDLYR